MYFIQHMKPFFTATEKIWEMKTSQINGKLDYELI